MGIGVRFCELGISLIIILSSSFIPSFSDDFVESFSNSTVILSSGSTVTTSQGEIHTTENFDKENTVLCISSSTSISEGVTNNCVLTKPLAFDGTINHKLEEGLYQKINGLMEDGETRYYKIIILVEQDDSPSGLNDAKLNKDKLEYVLISNHNAKNIYKGEILSFVAAEVPLDQITELSMYDYVSLIGDRELETVLFSSDNTSVRANIRADNTGYTGNGVTVAVIDTGIKQNHPDLPVGTKIIFQADCTGAFCIEYFGPNAAVDDDANHGTSVAGLIAAGDVTNPNRGVAFEAKIINAKSGVGDIPLALDWVMTKGADVANISIGTSCVNGYLSPALIADEAVDKGLIIVTAIGNGNVVSAPACAFNVITVGTTDDMGNGANRDDDVLLLDTTYTTFGPTVDGRIKPDIVAPGTLIFTQCGIPSFNYCGQIGSSFASAVLSGAVAQILEKNPDWTPAQIKAAIKQKGYLNSNLSPLTENQRGKGLIDIAATHTLSDSTIDYSLAYGIDLPTYIVDNISGNEVKYKLAKETSGTNTGSIFITQGKLKGINVFNKLAVASIKINGISQTLNDPKLFSGPRVDFTNQNNAANTYIKYKIGNELVQIRWLINAGDGASGVGSIQPFVVFDSSTTKTFEATQYLDFDIVTFEKDKSTNTANPAVTYNTEQKFTIGTQFYLIDNDQLATPWLNFGFGGDSTITEWILKWKSSQPPTDNPDTYYSPTESINPNGSGDDILIYYKGSRFTTFYFSGPSISVNWVSSPLIACLPPTDDWIIESDCTLSNTATAPANVIVQNNAIFTVPSGKTLDINFENKHLLVKSGGKVLVEQGGKLD